MANSLPVVFKTLSKFRENEFMCDVALEAEDRQFPVHKVILSASSEYFQTLFSTNMRERSQRLIEIKGISAQALDICIRTIYHEPIEIEGNVEDILHAACLFQLWDLKNQCFGLMKNALTPRNSFHYFKLSQMYDAGNFQGSTLKYIAKNFPTILHLPEFLDTSKEMLEILVGLDNLEIRDESQLFYTVINWIMHDEYYRKQHFCKLFKLIRLQHIPHAFIYENIIYHQLVRNCKNCSNYLKHWMIENCTNAISGQASSNRGGKNMLIVDENCMTVSVYNLEEKMPHKLDICIENLRTTLHCRLTTLIGSKLFVAGGIDDETLYCCDVVCESGWEKVSSMSVVHNTKVNNIIYISGTCQYAGRILVVGGHDGEDFLKIVEAFNLQTQQWEMLPHMNTARESTALAVAGKFVYVIGGFNGHGLSSVERFSFDSNGWTNVAPLHGCRYDSTATSYGDKIYVTGGVRGNNFMEHCLLNSVEMYSPADNSWTLLRELNYCRSNMGACVVSNKLFVFGGSGMEDSSLYEVFNDSKNIWESSEELNEANLSICNVFTF